MGQCCSKKIVEPHSVKEGPYIKTNAYSQSPSIEQIITVIIVIIQIVLHSVFFVPALPRINQAILWVILGLHYFLLLFLIYDYCYLTIKDPVDRLILNEQLSSKYHPMDLKTCLVCNCQVHKNSYHCNKCNRCTEEFDHHCKFLNNCIGSKNYEVFFRILLIYTFFNAFIIAQGIWIFATNINNQQTQPFKRNHWGVLALLIFTVLVLVFVFTLMIFHCYISCCVNTTTYSLNYQPKKTQKQKQKNYQINLWQAGPNSGQRLKPQEGKILY